MSETQLQIVLSLIDDASGQLQEAQAALGRLGQAGADAAAQISDSLTPAEEAIVTQATEAAEAWQGAMGEIQTSVEEAVPTIDEMLLGLGQANQTAAQEVAAAWRSQAQAMEDDLAAALATVEEDTAKMTEKVASSAGSMHGYFQGLIASYAMSSVGNSLLGGVEAAVSAAAGNPDKIAQLTDQINQQKASITTNEGELQKWNGTTLQVSAAHQKAAADIAAEKDKIAELQQQLQPLLVAQQAGGNAAKAYDDAVTKLSANWQSFLATSGAPLLDLLTKLVDVIDRVVVAMTAFADAHPRLTEAALIFMGILGGVLVIVASLVATFFIVTLTVGLVGGAFVAWGAIVVVAVATAVAIVLAYWDDFKAGTHLLIQQFQDAWNAFATWWTTFWNGVFAVIETVSNKIQAIISSIRSAISGVSGAVSGIAGAVGGAVGGVIHAFASGGIVTGPTLAMVGEAGPEAIIPLSAFAGGSSLAGAGGIGGGGGITVNVNGGMYLNQGGATEIANAIAKQVGQQLKLRNFF